MEKIRNNHPSNFWSGFFFGAVFALLMSFFLGTRKGREYLRKILEISENLEENLILLLKEIEDIEFTKNMDHKEIRDNKEIKSLPNIINRIKNRLTF